MARVFLAGDPNDDAFAEYQRLVVETGNEIEHAWWEIDNWDRPFATLHGKQSIAIANAIADADVFIHVIPPDDSPMRLQGFVEMGLAMAYGLEHIWMDLEAGRSVDYHLHMPTLLNVGRPSVEVRLQQLAEGL